MRGKLKWGKLKAEMGKGVCMGWVVLSEGERDKYPLVCEDAVAKRMEELLRERGAGPLLMLAQKATREEALTVARWITAERRERRRMERDERMREKAKEEMGNAQHHGERACEQ